MKPSDLINLIKEHANIDGVIFVGANLCREVKHYGAANFDPIIMFEPMPDVYQKLQDRVGHWPNATVHNWAISNYCGRSEFYVASNSVSSSLMEPKAVMKHQNVTVDNVIGVDVTTLDRAIVDKPAFSTLIIDTEGSELNVLKGAGDLLEHIEFICVELNFDENYESCPQHEEVIGYLEDKGFTKIHQRFGDRTKSYGDAIFIKN